MHQFGVVDQGWVSYLTMLALLQKPVHYLRWPEAGGPEVAWHTSPAFPGAFSTSRSIRLPGMQELSLLKPLILEALARVEGERRPGRPA